MAIGWNGKNGVPAAQNVDLVSLSGHEIVAAPPTRKETSTVCSHGTSLKSKNALAMTVNFHRVNICFK